MAMTSTDPIDGSVSQKQAFWIDLPMAPALSSAFPVLAPTAQP